MDHPAILTRRQQEIRDLVLQGLTNKEIAQRLNIVESTVKYHMLQILAKYRLDGRGNGRRLIMYRHLGDRVTVKPEVTYHV